MLAAQHLDDDEARTQMLRRLVIFPEEGGQRLRFSLLADLFTEAQANGEIDWQAVEAWAQTHDTEHGHEMPLNVGIFALGIEGEEERGLELLLGLARTPDYSDSYVLMARAILRAHGYTNDQMMPAGFFGHPWPEDAE